MHITLEVNNTEQLASVCGSFDRNLESIAKSLDVEINNKGEEFVIHGDNKHIAARILQDLSTLSKTQAIEVHDVEMSLRAYTQDDLPGESVNIKTKRKFIHVRSKNQQHYVKAIKDQDCTFGIGPAGTGKT
ncbi:MAG: phosphate starvation-inducible protein PhoH, partial [Candidatus Thioglobus sp.]|nr:phosphate starvation-inducible protein PhoH [Candidatus Thioglobus sp.]MBT6278460.1 phosphate starvation-inducible protein PhoH [Candidatus Thioglobus sp.]